MTSEWLEKTEKIYAVYVLVIHYMCSNAAVLFLLAIRYRIVSYLFIDISVGHSCDTSNNSWVSSHKKLLTLVIFSIVLVCDSGNIENIPCVTLFMALDPWSITHISGGLLYFARFCHILDNTWDNDLIFCMYM